MTRRRRKPLPDYDMERFLREMDARNAAVAEDEWQARLFAAWLAGDDREQVFKLALDAPGCAELVRIRMERECGK